MKKYAFHFYAVVSLLAIIFLGYSHFFSNNNGALEIEKQRLEEERAKHLEVREHLHAEIEKLQKVNKGLKNKYIKAIKEYENTKVHTSYDSAINDFFD